MKKFVFVFIVLIILILSSVYPYFSVYAEQYNYYRIISENAVFYSDGLLSKPVFVLPYSYYVKIVDENEYCYHVEYAFSDSYPSLDGYVAKNDLISDGTTTDSPFLSLKIHVDNTTVLFNDPIASKRICYVFYDKTVDFIGKCVDQFGNPLYFVSYDGKLGYVKSNDISPFTIPHHPNGIIKEEPEDVSPPTVNDGPVAETNGVLILKIIIILCIAFSVAVFIAILIDKKRSHKRKESYFEENDY